LLFNHFSELQGIDISIWFHTMVLYMHPLRLEYLGTAAIEDATRAEKFIWAQIVYKHCSSHDKNHWKVTIPFCCT